MDAATESFRAVLMALWLRLITLSLIVVLIVLTAWLPGRVNGWSFYLTTGEVVFEVAVRVIFVALIGVALGTLCTVASVPFLLFRASSREHIANVVTRIAVAATAFACVWCMLKTVLDSFAGIAHLSWFPMRIVFFAYCAAFAVALCIPRRRAQVVTSLDGILGKKATRRTAIVTGIASAALVAGELVAGKVAAASVKTGPLARRTGPNVLLVTFDALSAEDLSAYGYRLSTTPNIDKFARQSTLFANYYSASTFTTACVASIVTGLHPSDNHVYHLQGDLRLSYGPNTLPRLMRAGGYSTGASINNPAAYYLAEGIAGGFDALPKAAHRRDALHDLWDRSEFLHQRQPFGSREGEFFDFGAGVGPALSVVAKAFPALDPRHKYIFPSDLVFAQARESLLKLPDNFFLWVHVFAPHAPYLPDEPYLGRFLDPRDVDASLEGIVSPRYPVSEQKKMDKGRLRYDELLAEADSNFGTFLAALESDGRLQNTAVVVSADHGESFEGGFYGHDFGYQTRPAIHIPLIVRMPGQQRGYRVGLTADQTTLAPTLLDIARLPRPDSMRGQSLVPWLNRDNEGDGEGLAFTQYLSTDSIFKPLNSGTVGVIDGQNQYVLNLATGKGELRGIAEAQICDLDRSAENPALAQTLREVIYSRFPRLPRKA